MCPKCGGDVRLPPLTTTETNVTPALRKDEEATKLEKQNDKGDAEAALESITVKCALSCCPAPRYHLKCSGIPRGSQIFRNAVITHQNSVRKQNNAKQIIDHLYASSERVWWDLPSDTKVRIDGQQLSQKTQQSLQNDINWPTSMESFMCPDCDVEGGKSRFLCEYFERFHSMKASFYADYLTALKSDVRGDRRDKAEESVEIRTGEAFLQHLIMDNRKRYLNKSQTNDTSVHLDSWNPSEIQLENMAFTKTFLSKQLQNERMKQHLGHQKYEPSKLVGMPIRLFNPIDNSYHSGRVLDCRCNAPYKVDKSADPSSAPIGQLIDEEICSTLFLIRFRHGVEGRKIAIHQWIYLEEHAVTVGGEVCLAKVGNNHQRAKAGLGDEEATHASKPDAKLQTKNGEYASQYRPVQILFRSMLEMVPVHNLSPLISSFDITKPLANKGTPLNESRCLNVLAMGFGRSFSHVRLSLDDSGHQTVPAKRTLSELDETQKSIFDETARCLPVALPLTSSNPPLINQIILRAQLSDENVALSLAMACMEKEEERRIQTWRQEKQNYRQGK